MNNFFYALIFSVLFLVGGCQEETYSCEIPPDEDCLPLYSPTFEAVYTETLAKSCGVGEGSCHGPAGNQGGLTFDGKEASFLALLGEEGQGTQVLPFDPECSPIMIRLQGHGKAGQMPPGAPLSEAERCAVATWIRQGANP